MRRCVHIVNEDTGEELVLEVSADVYDDTDRTADFVEDECSELGIHNYRWDRSE
jgi:hypothetical protein